MWGNGGTGEEVILVPADRKDAFLNPDQVDHIRMHADDCSSWIRPDDCNLKILLAFIGEHSNSLSQFWCPHTGTRLGFDERGVYLHQDHLRRYFGIVREFASIVLRNAVPEVVGKTNLAGRKGAGTSEKMLGRMLGSISTVSDTVRDDVLRAAFRGCDKDGNGVLEKDEMVGLIRRVMPTMSGKQVCELMEQADSDKNNCVDYQEFVTWLNRYAPQEIRSRLTEEMETEYDCVRAVFRLWDRNGDGLITKKELVTVLKRTCPDMTLPQVDIMCLHLDKNKDGQIDYDEFLGFLFA